MRSLAIRTQRLGKEYRLGAPRARYRTLRDVVGGALAAPGAAARAAVRRGRGRSPATETIWALRDVTLDIGRGEAVGLIGRNGAGKSTLLKLLSRITGPTAGTADIYGRVGSLLEVGTGFHQELTGRENILLNGAILGMRRAEILAKLDAIVAFAEVDRFIDTPVKHYSSGMYLRLAFAVAAHLEPEILLVDEVLAVGDAEFQKKCLGKMRTVTEEERTVLFVSHNMSAIRTLCRRAIWLDAGAVRCDGDVDEVIGSYLGALTTSRFQPLRGGARLTVDDVVLRDGTGSPCTQFRPGDDIVVEVSYTAHAAIEPPYVILLVESPNGSCCSANMLLDGRRPPTLDGPGRISCRFKAVPLLPQTYSVKLEFRAGNGRDMVLPLSDVASFTIAADLEEYGFIGEYRTLASRATPVVIPYEWVLPDGSVHRIALT